MKEVTNKGRHSLHESRLSCETAKRPLRQGVTSEAAVLYLQTKGETFILQAGKDTNRMPKNLSLTPI